MWLSWVNAYPQWPVPLLGVGRLFPQEASEAQVWTCSPNLLYLLSSISFKCGKRVTLFGKEVGDCLRVKEMVGVLLNWVFRV